MTPPAVRQPTRPYRHRSAPAAMLSPIFDAAPVETVQDKTLYCPMCGNYRAHYVVTDTANTYRCRVCGREREVAPQRATTKENE